MQYAFTVPIQQGKTQVWKNYVKELLGTRKKEHEASRKRLGLAKEQVWLQKTPMGDFAVVYFETDDVQKVFEGMMKSSDTYDKWFREKILVEVHGMNPAGPPPPMNERIV